MIGAIYLLYSNEILKKRVYYVNCASSIHTEGGFQMKGTLKKLVVYSMLGLMQVGLFATASASPRVEEPSVVEECCGDSVCLQNCTNGVTYECKTKYQSKTMPTDVFQEGIFKNILNKFLQGGYTQSTCNK